MRKKIAAGNWKMNGLRKQIAEIDKMSKTGIRHCEVIICPSFSILYMASEKLADTNIRIGAQNVHFEESGAFTGEISVEMIKDAGASHVIVGHSERREYFGENDEIIAKKALAVQSAGLTAIICVGETLKERESGQAISVVTSQIKGSIPKGSNANNTIIAYEPVWAIGTGKVPSMGDIAEIHAAIRAEIPDADNMRILYGGSVKANNAEEIFAIDNVDGGLVGGASLKAEDFIPIINAAEKLSS